MANGADCPVINAGEFDATTGRCYELTVDTAETSSLFPMTTGGISGVVIFAQHLPIEFERDRHYLKDTTGTDIEPVAREGGDGHDHDHGHDHGGGRTGPSCACAAQDVGFEIDCSAQTAMTDSLDFLNSGGWGTDCSTDACQKAWYIVQTHHDYCDTDAIPATIEDGFHDFDDACTSCEISRKATDGVPDCPAASCEDDAGHEAFAFLVDNGCANDCTTDACVAAYLTLRAVHDDCDHDVLSSTSEVGLHDFEDVCIAKCNTPASLSDQLTCAEGSSSATAALQGTVALAATCSALAFITA